MARGRVLMCWLAGVAAVVLSFVAAPARAQSYRDEQYGWRIDLPPGWQEVKVLAELTQAELRTRMPSANFEFQTAFAPKQRSSNGYPYVLVQISNTRLRGMSHEDLEEAFSAEMIDEAESMVTEKLPDLLADAQFATPRLDRARNRILFEVSMDVAGTDVRGLMVNHLGADWSVQLNYYAERDKFESGLAEFELMCDGFAFDEGRAFVPRVRSGLLGVLPSNASPWTRMLVMGLIGGLVGAVVGVVSKVMKARRG